MLETNTSDRQFDVFKGAFDIMDDGHGEPRKRAPRDFTFGEVLGEGSFSTVLQASEPSTGREFAVSFLMVYTI